MSDTENEALGVAAPSPFDRAVLLTASATCGGLVAVFLLRTATKRSPVVASDFLGHLGASAALTLAVVGLAFALRRVAPTLRFAILAGAVVSVALELAQAFVPARIVELDDVSAGMLGVVILALAVDVLFAQVSPRSGARLCAAAAGLTTIALLAILVTEDAHDSLADRLPDGQSCPVTSTPSQQLRIVIGDLRLEGTCVSADDIGGLGLVGTMPVAGRFGSSTVLSTSTLPELAGDIRETQHLTMRAEIVTGKFEPDGSGPARAVLHLTSEDQGLIVLLAIRENQMQIWVAQEEAPIRTAEVRLAALSPESVHTLELRLTDKSMEAFVDGTSLTKLTINPGWIDVIGDDLRLIVGNIENGARPFDGTINWVEISAAP